MRGKEKRLISL